MCDSMGSENGITYQPAPNFAHLPGSPVSAHTVLILASRWRVRQYHYPGVNVDINGYVGDGEHLVARSVSS